MIFTGLSNAQVSHTCCQISCHLVLLWYSLKLGNKVSGESQMWYFVSIIKHKNASKLRRKHKIIRFPCLSMVIVLFDKRLLVQVFHEAFTRALISVPTATVYTKTLLSMLLQPPNDFSEILRSQSPYSPAKSL